MTQGPWRYNMLANGLGTWGLCMLLKEQIQNWSVPVECVKKEIKSQSPRITKKKPQKDRLIHCWAIENQG